MCHHIMDGNGCQEVMGGHEIKLKLHNSCDKMMMFDETPKCIACFWSGRQFHAASL